MWCAAVVSTSIKGKKVFRYGNYDRYGQERGWKHRYYGYRLSLSGNPADASKVVLCMCV